MATYISTSGNSLKELGAPATSIYAVGRTLSSHFEEGAIFLGTVATLRHALESFLYGTWYPRQWNWEISEVYIRVDGPDSFELFSRDHGLLVFDTHDISAEAQTALQAAGADVWEIGRQGVTDIIVEGETLSSHSSGHHETFSAEAVLKLHNGVLLKRDKGSHHVNVR